MSISPELKAKALACYEAVKNIETPTSDKEFIIFPVFIDGVIDQVRYNVKEKRFDKVILSMAAGVTTEADWLLRDVGYSDAVDYVSIEIEK